MSNLRRQIENIEIDNEKYILAFDMTSVDIFKDINGKGILNSLLSLNKLEDKTVFSFIASTLRKEDDPDNPLGLNIFDGRFDLFLLLIQLTPYVLSIVKNGFPQADSKKKENLKDK